MPIYTCIILYCRVETVGTLGGMSVGVYRSDLAGHLGLSLMSIYITKKYIACFENVRCVNNYKISLQV